MKETKIMQISQKIQRYNFPANAQEVYSVREVTVEYNALKVKGCACNSSLF
jgi:hypothetical protein